MAYTTFTDYNVSSVQDILTYPAVVVPFFWDFVLFAVFCIVTLSTFFASTRLKNKGDIMVSISVAAWFTTILSFVMSLIPGMISLATIVVCIAVSIISFIMLLFSRE